MPYLELPKDDENQEDIKTEVTVPDLTGLTKEEAKKKLKGIGLEIEVKQEEKEGIIINQLPKAGIKIKQGNSVIVYY